VEQIARRLIPRRADGDMLDVSLSPQELLAFSLLTRARRRPPLVPRREVKALLGRAPAVPPAAPLSAFAPRRSDPRLRRTPVTSMTGDAVWDAALSGLLAQGLLREEGDALAPRARAVDLFEGLAQVDRHTVVRTDFVDDEWLLRETTFLPQKGALVAIASDADGRVRVRDLDGTTLRSALREAIGAIAPGFAAPAAALARASTAPPAVSAEREDDDTEVALTRPVASEAAPSAERTKVARRRGRP
jgi:hypothetical protein